MNYGIFACTPLIVLIICVLATKRMTESLLISSVLAALLVYKQNFLTGYFELAYQTLSNTSFQLLLMIAPCFGGMICLLEKSGALLGFQKIMEQICTTSKKSLVFTWVLGGLIFIDDYLNALAVSVSMKGISDNYRIPREHLAYTVNCMGACVCVLLPVSSWSAFAIGCLGEYHLSASDYYRAIPLMFYPICAIVICFLLAINRFPKIGHLKKSYMRVNNGGDVLIKEESQSGIVQLDMETTNKASNIMYFIVPMIVLFAGTLFFENNILIGIFLSLIVMAIMYITGKLMSLKDYIDTFLKGVGSMSGLLFNIAIAFMIQAACDKMQFTEFVIRNYTQIIAKEWIPVTAFLLVALLAFLAASFWTLIVITFPVFITMAQQVGIDPSIIIAAIMSGVALGSQACIYSDAMFMVAAGTDVSNDSQFRTVLPYVLIGAIIAAAMFLLAGYIK